jgi:polar amino acid transport system permease protein
VTFANLSMALHGIWLELPRFFSYYNILLLGQAMLSTIALSLIGGAIGFAAGGVLAVLRIRRVVDFLPLRLLAILYVEIFRRIPFLVKLLVIFFGFQVLGLQAPLFVVALVTVSLSATAFASELIRAGLLSVHANQIDAAQAMNFGRMQLLFMVMLPQSWRVILPPTVGYLAGFVKSTSIASQVGVLELTYAAKIMNTKGFSALLCFGTVLILYFAICYPLSLLGAWLEKRLDYRRRPFLAVQTP